MATMLSDPRLLTEDYRTEDLFAFDTFANDLAGKTTAAPNKSLLGIVGGYGLGKSTLLQKVRQSMEGDFIWVHFDA